MRMIKRKTSRRWWTGIRDVKVIGRTEYTRLYREARRAIGLDVPNNDRLWTGMSEKNMTHAEYMARWRELRALEAASQSGEILPYQGETNIFIYPGYTFHAVDALITNFHLPSSTLLMLVCAFAGHNQVMHAYALAVSMGYRFYSYGDAMYVNRI